MFVVGEGHSDAQRDVFGRGADGCPRRFHARFWMASGFVAGPGKRVFYMLAEFFFESPAECFYVLPGEVGGHRCKNIVATGEMGDGHVPLRFRAAAGRLFRGLLNGAGNRIGEFGLQLRIVEFCYLVEEFTHLIAVGADRGQMIGGIATSARHAPGALPDQLIEVIEQPIHSRVMPGIAVRADE